MKTIKEYAGVSFILLLIALAAWCAVKSAPVPDLPHVRPVDPREKE